mgnify:CR=1 FL=1
MSRNVVYVAGPYRGETREAVEINISVAKAVGLLCARKGWTPLIPHCNTAGFELLTSELDDQFWLDATMKLMRRCDAVVLIPGWERSSGTLAEIAEAKRLGIKIHYSEAALPEYKK